MVINLHSQVLPLCIRWVVDLIRVSLRIRHRQLDKGLISETTGQRAVLLVSAIGIGQTCAILIIINETNPLATDTQTNVKVEIEIGGGKI
jgi:cell division protein FtsX